MTAAEQWPSYEGDHFSLSASALMFNLRSTAMLAENMQKKRQEEIEKDGRVSHRRNILPEARNRFVPVDTLRIIIRSESDEEAPAGIDRLIVRFPIVDPELHPPLLDDVVAKIATDGRPIVPNDLFLETVTVDEARARYLLNGSGLYQYETAEDVQRIEYDTDANDMFEVIDGVEAPEMIDTLNHMMTFIPGEQSTSDTERP